MGQVLELASALIKRELPEGVSYEQAERRHLELKLELYERMAAERPDDRDVAQQLEETRQQFAELESS